MRNKKFRCPRCGQEIRWVKPDQLRDRHIRHLMQDHRLELEKEFQALARLIS